MYAYKCATVCVRVSMYLPNPSVTTGMRHPVNFFLAEYSWREVFLL